MWLILHFIFVFVTQPSAWMHFLGAIFMLPLIRYGQKFKKKDIGCSFGLLLMYIGFYVSEELYHFSFLPWWVTTMCGFRRKRLSIMWGGVFWGFVMHALTWRGRFGSFLMNMGRMMKVERTSIVSQIVVHIILGIFRATETIEFQQKDILAALSVAMCTFWYDNMQWFSIAMLFTNPLSCGICIIHFTNFKWYDYFKNNHFRKVKYSASYVYPILILVALFFREEITMWKSYLLKA